MSELKEETYYTMEDILALPEGQRAELIDGRIYMMTPPKRLHQKCSVKIAHLILSHIESEHLPCEVYTAPFGVWPFNDDTTYVEPDISVICDESKLDDDGCKGAPDFIIEILSKSTEAYDKIDKLGLYRTAGVREYWIVDPGKRRVNKYVFSPVFWDEVISFEEDIPVSICEGFNINFQEAGF